MYPGETAHTVDGKGVIDTAREGDFHVDGECSVHFTLPSANPGTATPIQMRGFLVNGGKEILAFQTGPGAMVSARLVGLPDTE